MLAHQGGWDELLLIIGPVIVVIALLRLAKRRVSSVHSDARDDPSASRADR